MRGERSRHRLAVIGIVWWLLFPIVYVLGTRAAWMYRCENRTFSGEFDHCFNDGIPVFELLSPFITLALSYAFARFAFAIFAPAPEERIYRWRLAGRSGGSAYFPAFQLAAGFGVAWALLHLSRLPISGHFWYLTFYWFGWVAWFGTGIFSSWPARTTMADRDA